MIEGKKISKLDPINNLQDGCCFPVLSRGATKRITFASLVNNILSRLPDPSQEEIDEIKETVAKLEKQLADVSIDNKEVEELLKNVTFTIQGQNDTILEYTAKVREFEQEIGSSSIAESIEHLNSLIPSQATETNKLIDEESVNEKIQTETAVNRGSFNSHAALIAYSGTVTRNDYAYVADDETHDHEAWRYKWNDETEEWTAEYRINESPMTQAQLAALNSGITEEKIEELEDDIEQAKDDADKALDRISYTEEDIMSLREYVEEELSELHSMDFPANTTILEWAKLVEAGKSAMITQSAIPSDAPTQSEYSLLVIGNGNRKTVIAYEYLSHRVFFRHLYYSDTSWRNSWIELVTSQSLSEYTTFIRDPLEMGDLRKGYCDGTSINIPINFAWGTREYAYISENQVIITLTGVTMDTIVHHWVNVYNFGNWSGWKETIN